MPRVTNTISTNANSVSTIVNKVPSYYNNYRNDREDLTQSELILKSTTAARTSNIDPSNTILDVAFQVGVQKVIAHKLQRQYKGFIVKRPRGNHPISIIEVAQNNPTLDAVQITLASASTCTVDLEIY